ncbi:unnamed protein product [Clonostachys rosea]|uniref:Heterokaryon incompatibility domain-containing protein n=1 Tax=Bionectria ochroleuca TaxID=29856 RepID=A0ABY6UNC8_BIOOC|nr:unnamed protein product [Clonostachys rosea]
MSTEPQRLDPAVEYYRSIPLLSTNTIRVLDVSQCTNGAGYPSLSGALRVVNLDDDPTFTALSYVWGEYSSPKDALNCNGYEIEITKNCWSALSSLTRSQGPLTIWIDAICINQADDNEKQHQIPLMAKVFSSAKVTYAWLGEGDPEASAAMDLIAKGGLPFEKFITRRLKENPEVPTGNAMAFRLALYIYKTNILSGFKSRGKNLENILNSRWITRLWTLQEAVLSKNLLIVYGDHSAPWISVIHLLQLAMARCDDPFYHILPSIASRWWSLYKLWSGYHPDLTEAVDGDFKRQLKYLKRGFRGFSILFAGTEILLPVLCVVLFVQIPAMYSPYIKFSLVLTCVFSLFYVLATSLTVFGVGFWMNRRSKKKALRQLFPLSPAESFIMEVVDRKSTFKSDKYFGILCLTKHPQDVPPPVPINATIDRVYTALFKHLLACTRSLDLLLFTGEEARVQGTPSWVVNWSSCRSDWMEALFYFERERTSRGEIKKLGKVTNPGYGGTPRLSRYHGATPQSVARWTMLGDTELAQSHDTQPPEEQAVLIVEGAIVSRVRFVSKLMPEAQINAADYEFCLRFTQDLLDATRYSDLEATTFGLKRICLKLFKRTNMGLVVPWSKAITRGAANGAAWTVERLKGLFLRGGWYPVFHYRHIWKLAESLAKGLAEKRMPLVACQGDLLTAFGVAANGVREGDAVALVSGVSLPVILREVPGQGRYQVIGPTFIPATLAGSVWEKLNADSLDSEV